jgi:hypothetical protein
MCKDSDPVAQRIHRENADRMLLASFVAGLSEELGKQIKFQNLPHLRQALTIALTVTVTLKQEKFAETFYTKFDKSVRLPKRQDDRATAEMHGKGARQTTREEGVMHATRIGQGLQVALGTSNPRRNLVVTSAKGVGTSRENAPLGKNAKNTQNAPERKNPSERSNRSRLPGHEALRKKTQGFKETSMR